MRSGQRLGDDLKWGITWGIAFAIYFSLIALALWALGWIAGGDPFEQIDVTLGSTLAYYFGAGLVAGIMIGLLRPIAERSFGGKIIVSTVTAFVVWLGCIMLVRPPDFTAEQVLLATGILTVISGPLVAYFVKRGWY